MANNNRDVNLTIKARDEASKTFAALVDSLKEFVGSQEKLGNSAQKVDGLLGKLNQSAGALTKEIAGFAALGKAAQQLDSLSAAITRSENAFKRTKGSTSQLISDYGRTAEATRKLKEQADQAKAAFDRQSDALTVLKGRLDTLRNSKDPFDKLKTQYVRDEVRQLTEALKPLRKNMVEANAAVAASEAQQRKLRAAAVSSTLELGKQSVQLSGLKREAVQLTAAADPVRSALGGIALNQQALGERSAKTAEQLAKVTAELDRQQKSSRSAGGNLSGAAAVTAAYRNQVQAVRDARTAWKDAEAEATRLGQAMRQVAQPTQQMQASFLLAQTASRAARQEYEAQAGTLNRLKGVAAGTFAEFDKRAQAIQRGSVALQASNAAAFNAAAAETKLKSAINGTAAAQERSAQASAKQVSGLGRSLALQREALSLGQRLRGEILSLTASYVGLYAAINQIGSVVDAFQTLEAVQSRLNVVFNGNFERTGQEIKFLREEAIRLGISFGVLGDSYSKFAVAANSADFASENTRKIFTSVTEAARVNKISVENMQGVFLALEQMISKGKVTSEELRRQLGDRLPGAFNIFADALGMTTMELDAAMRKGEVFSSQTNLLAFAEELDKRFGKQLPSSLETLTTQIGKFQAILFDLKVQVAQAGFAEELRKALLDLNKALQSDDGKQAVQALSDALSLAVRGVVLLVKNFDLVILAAKAFIGLKLARYAVELYGSFGGLVTRLTETRTAFALIGTQAKLAFTQSLAFSRGASAGVLSFSGAAAVATGSVRALGVAVKGFIASFGPVGLAFAAISVIGEVVAGLYDPIDKSNTLLEVHEKIVQRVRDAYVEAQGDVTKWADKIKDLTAFEVQTAALEEMKRQAEAMANIKLPDENWFFIGTDLRAGLEDLRSAIKAFREGSISADEFRKKVSEVALENGGYTDDWIQSLLDASRTVEESKKRVKEYDEVLKAMSGTADDTSVSVLGLADAASEAQKAIDPAAFDAYGEALDKVKGLIPELGAELDRLKKQADLSGLVTELQKLGPLSKDTLDLIERAKSSIDVEFFSKNSGASSLERSVQLLKQFEGFKPSAYFDVNAYRAGYGSDTVTLSDGTIQKITQGMTVSQTDALRDLVRRIGEFQDVVKAQVGSERFNAFSAEQQAALTSIAYNYGSLPERIVEAVKTGSADQIATAVRGLKGDNGGINAGRREAEAQILAQSEGNLQASNLKIQQQKLAEQQKFNDSYDQYIGQIKYEIGNAKETERQQAINNALREQELAAKKAGIDLTDQQRAQIKQLAAEQYDAANAQKQAEEQVNQLVERRKLLMDQIEFYQSQGNSGMVDQLTGELSKTDSALRSAIDNAIKFWEAIGGADAQNKILVLENLKNQIQQTGTLAKISAKEINDDFINGASSAFDKFSEAVANGANVVDSLRDAFLSFAADFLRQIAQMIIQQALFNALGGSGGQGGVGGFIATAIGALFHTGGVVGSTNAPTRAISPAWFHKAVRYHEGGIAGLQPGEVPAILKKGEEVLTANDPRHVMNGGAAGGGQSNVRIVNAIDAPGFLQAALNTSQGEQLILNFLQANSVKAKGALGV